MLEALLPNERSEISRLWRQAESLRTGNHPALAEPLYRRMLCLLPAVADIWIRRAVTATGSGTACAYERAAILLPVQAELRRSAAEAFWLGGDRSRARRNLDHAVCLAPLDPSVWRTTALVAREEGGDDGNPLRHGLLLDPSDWRLTSEIGFLVTRAREHKAGISWQRRARRLAPDAALPKRALAEAVRGFVPEAPDRPFLMDLLALIEPDRPWPRSILRALLALLRFEPDYLRAEDALASAAGSEALDDIAALLTQSGFVALLGEAVLPDQKVEALLTALRGLYLARWNSTELQDLPEPAMHLLVKLADHCHLHEYSLRKTPKETEALTDLGPGTIPELLLMACYASVDRVWNGTPPLEGGLLRFRRRHIDEPLAERAAAGAMTQLTKISSGVSEAVGQQYEQNPYPRWRYLPQGTGTDIWRQLAAQFPSRSALFAGRPSDPNLLIAGCGTGQEACIQALQFPSARITALDLSRTSLGYASMRAAEAGLSNIRFGQADILNLEQLGMQFEIIESVGVLHHMLEPAAGLAVLAKLLKSGGVMHLGFYSRRGRVAVNAARALIAEWGLAADAGGIREARQRLFDLRPTRPDLSGLFVSPDFYSSSGCRDLIFHVQEHQYDAEGLRRLAEGAGLDLLGFELLADRRAAYERDFPDDPEASDWDKIERFEQKMPWAFSEMFRFWLVKP